MTISLRYNIYKAYVSSDHAHSSGKLHFEFISYEFTCEDSLIYFPTHHPFLQQFIWIRQDSSFRQALSFMQ